MARILIVEDNEMNLEMLSRRLMRRSIEIVTAVDGVEGLARAKDSDPDLIIMDVQLPEASGLEVTQWLKAEAATSDIPIVAVTALAMKGDEERVLSVGCDAYIAKPISVHQFLDTVKRFLG